MMRAGLRNAPPDIDARLAHELADCLWSVLVLAHEHGVHLEAAFSRTMAEIQRTGPAAPASGKC
jgi:phosphoribosyl-ATP pyrophosphohydrolase